MKYLIVIEDTQTGFSAFSPDVQGRVATGASVQEAEQNMREAISFHLDGMRKEGLEIPKPTCRSSYIEIEAA